MHMFLDMAVLYYVILLGRSVFISLPLILLIMLLRITVFQKAVFSKGLLWGLLIPVPFMGKLKFYYESAILAKPFQWWQKFCTEHIWVCYLYIGIVIVLGSFLWLKRRKLNRYIKTLKRREINGRLVYVSELEITPFVSGILKPQIVLPERMLWYFDEKELETILWHEQEHIRQGHLFFYLLWDIGKILLWMNPLLFYCTGYFHSDLEDMCDKAVIGRLKHDFYYYGKVLLKSIRCLKADKDYPSDITAFAADSGYDSMKRRILKVSAYKPYRKTMLWSMATVAGVVLSIFLAGIYHTSYRNCNQMNVVSLYDVTDDKMLLMIDQEKQADIFSYDEKNVYVNTAALSEVIQLDDYEGKKLGIFFDSYYKIPGLGLGGELIFVNKDDLKGKECRIAYEKSKETFLLKLLKRI